MTTPSETLGDSEIGIAEFERMLDAELRRLFPDLFDSTEPARSEAQ